MNFKIFYLTFCFLLFLSNINEGEANDPLCFERFNIENCHLKTDKIKCHQYEQPYLHSTDVKELELEVLVHKFPTEISVLICHKLELDTMCDEGFFGQDTIRETTQLKNIRKGECRETNMERTPHPEPDCKWNSINHNYIQTIEGIKHKAFVDIGTGRILYPGYEGHCDLYEEECLSDNGLTVIKHELKKELIDKHKYSIVKFLYHTDMNDHKYLYNRVYGNIQMSKLKKVILFKKEHLILPDGAVLKMSNFSDIEKFTSSTSIPNPDGVSVNENMKLINRRTKSELCELSSIMYDYLKHNNVINLNLLHFFQPLYTGHQEVLFANKSGIIECLVYISELEYKFCLNNHLEMFRANGITHSPFYKVKDNLIFGYSQDFEIDDELIPIGERMELHYDSEIFNLHKKYNFSSHQAMINGHKSTIGKHIDLSFFEGIGGKIRGIIDYATTGYRWIKIILLTLFISFIFFVIIKFAMIFYTYKLRQPVINIQHPTFDNIEFKDIPLYDPRILTCVKP